MFTTKKNMKMQLSKLIFFFRENHNRVVRLDDIGSHGIVICRINLCSMLCLIVKP